MKTMEGLATSSTAMVSLLRCSTDKPLWPGRPTTAPARDSSSTSPSTYTPPPHKSSPFLLEWHHDPYKYLLHAQDLTLEYYAYLCGHCACLDCINRNVDHAASWHMSSKVVTCNMFNISVDAIKASLGDQVTPGLQSMTRLHIICCAWFWIGLSQCKHVKLLA